MKLRLVKAAAATAIAAAAIFAVPAAASAYTPVPPSGVTTVVNGVVTLPFTGFQPNESVTFTLTGENASGATLGYVKFAVQTANLGTKAANASGAVSATVTLPSNASGVYTLVADGATSASVSTTITVTASGGSTGLAATGSDSGALLGLWVGGGALVLAGASIAVAGTVRRQRSNNVAA